MSNSYVGRHRAVIAHRQVGRHRATRPGLHGWTPWLRWAAVTERTHRVYHPARNLTSILGFLSRFARFADSVHGGRQRTLSGKVGHLAPMAPRVHPGLSRQAAPPGLARRPHPPT